MGADIAERVGKIAGAGIAPVIAAIAAARRSRMFHPRGVVLGAEVRAVPAEQPWRALGARLEGDAIVRLSSAWWKSHEWPDVLGCAIRFTAPLGAEQGPLRAETPERVDVTTPRPGDQDLLFATILRPYAMAIAPLMTDHRDFFANRYYAVSPFRAGDERAIEWRLSPVPASAEHGGSRRERLQQRMARGEAVFTLEARPYRRAWQIAGEHPFHAVALLDLVRPLEIDQGALRFDPFRAGRGIHPIGLIHSLRPGAYGASQWARPPSEPAGDEGSVVASGATDVVPTIDAARARNDGSGDRARRRM